MRWNSGLFTSDLFVRKPLRAMRPLVLMTTLPSFGTGLSVLFSPFIQSETTQAADSSIVAISDVLTGFSKDLIGNTW